MNLFYNNLLENLLLPVGDAILGTTYIKELKRWRQIQKMDEQQLKQLSSAKLNSVLKHAVENIPAYAFLKNKPELKISDFPITHKADIKRNIDNFMWHPEKKNNLILEKSSGSSGIQGEIYMNKQEQSKIIALQTLLWEWAGYQIGYPMLQTGMTTNRGFVKSVKDFLFRVDYNSAFGLNEKVVLDVLQNFKRKKRNFFGGYASSLNIFAITAKKYNLNQIQFDAVISWGDKLFDHYRKAIEETFQTKVYDTYGTTEGFVIGGQKDLPFLYILTPMVHVEIVDKHGNEVRDGELGYVVVTHLDAFEMPLIRYYLGDLAIKMPKDEYPLQKELAFPLFKKIIGRDTDMVVTPGGRYMIVHSFTVIFEHCKEIKQFRVIQNQKESITIEYIPDEGFNTVILDSLRKKIIDQLGEEIIIHFEEKEIIPPTPSGKPQIVISQIKY